MRQKRPILFRPLHAWLVGPSKEPLSREPLAGVLYKRATAAVTTATESTAVTTARERAWRWEASCGGRGDVEIPFGSELHVFLKLPRHLADAEPGACGHACLRLSAVPGER